MVQTLDLRFVVGIPNGPHSDVWRAKSHGNHVYVMHRGLGGVCKISFHERQICRYAFTREHGCPTALPSRAMSQWLRVPTPPVGSNGGSCVLMVAFPSDYLSTTSLSSDKPVTWITPAPPGQATVIEGFFAMEAPETVAHHFALSGNRTLLSYTRLPNGEGFVFCSSFIEWKNRDLLMPASHEESRSMLFSADDPNATGKPIRLTRFSAPKDGDALVAIDLGGFIIPPDFKISGLESVDTFTRNVVLAKGGNSKSAG